MANPLGPLRAVGEALRAFAAKHPDLFALGRQDLVLPKYPAPEGEPTKEYLARLNNGPLSYMAQRYQRPGQALSLTDRNPTRVPGFGYVVEDTAAQRPSGVRPALYMMKDDSDIAEVTHPGLESYDIDAASASAPGVPGLGVQLYYPLWDLLEHIGGVNVTSGLTADNTVRKPQGLQSYIMRGNSGDPVVGSSEFFNETTAHPLDRDLKRYFMAADPGGDYGQGVAYARQFRRMSPAERVGALALANRGSLEHRVGYSAEANPNQLRAAMQWPLSRPAFADTLTPLMSNRGSRELGDVWKMGTTSRKRGLFHNWLVNKAYEGDPVSADQLDQAYRDFPDFFNGLYFRKGGAV